jgi:hypothetical protein
MPANRTTRREQEMGSYTNMLCENFEREVKRLISQAREAGMDGRDLADIMGREAAELQEELVTAPFDSCPTCHKTDGYANVSRSHWFYCKEHQKKWCAGSNLLSSWRDETEAEQREKYDAIGLGQFDEVVPHFNVVDFCGWSGNVMARISEILGMTNDEIIRNGLDLDLFDCARLLVDKGVNLSDRKAVEEALFMSSQSPPRWVDAVIEAARPASSRPAA